MKRTNITLPLYFNIYPFNKINQHKIYIAIMYIILDRTNNVTYKHEGNYPYDVILSMLQEGSNIIIISTYSNTIKIPQLEIENGIEQLGECKEYTFPKELIAPKYRSK